MTKLERQTLTEQLRRAIEASGITMYKLSQESGVDRSQLSRFMRGERDMSLAVSDKICEILGLQFCTTKNEAPLSPTEDCDQAPPSTPPASELLDQAGAKKRGKADEPATPKRPRGRPKKGG